MSLKYNQARYILIKFSLLPVYHVLRSFCMAIFLFVRLFKSLKQQNYEYFEMNGSFLRLSTFL